MTDLCRFQDKQCPMDGAKCIRAPLCKRIAELEAALMVISDETDDLGAIAVVKAALEKPYGQDKE